MFAVSSFLDLASFEHHRLFDGCTHVWDGLKRLKPYMEGLHFPDYYRQDLFTEGIPLTEPIIVLADAIISGAETTIEYGDVTKGELRIFRNGQLLAGASLIMAGAVLLGRKIALGKGVLIETGAMVKSPAIIGDQTEVRHGAYIRGYCLTGKSCVIGHATEVKHSIFLDHAKAGHFAYIGDSILGNHVNLGAGTKLANLRFTQGEVPIRTPDGQIMTGLRKLGALLGDQVQTGCNSVTNPGTILGKKSFVLPNTTVPSGLHDSGSLIR
jgi:bifunctional N-acetylglucosamine-1-phosphate-uridyltransferase/glucosamine-1-phosphate-acetyltransferase GlmU-like protein